MEWEKEWEKIKCFATQAGQSIGFENNKDIDFISAQIEKAKQEERDRICKEMTGEYKIIKEGYSNELNDFGYNERVREEIEKAKTLLT